MDFSPMTKTIFSLFISGLVFSLAAGEPQERERTYETINANVTAENIAFFKDYLAGCEAGEVRCVWFMNNHIMIGMVMTIDLHKYRVTTVREVYNFASQNEERRTLSHAQVSALKGIAPKLPPSTPDVRFGEGIHIAFMIDKKVQIRSYDRRAAPRIVQRLYDLGGGYLDAQYAAE